MKVYLDLFSMNVVEELENKKILKPLKTNQVCIDLKKRWNFENLKKGK